MAASERVEEVDLVLVGAGIMSATLGVFLKELQPHLKLEVIESLPGEAARELGCLEQCRDRPRCQLRTQLHTDARRREHRH